MEVVSIHLSIHVNLPTVQLCDLMSPGFWQNTEAQTLWNVWISELRKVGTHTMCPTLHPAFSFPCMICTYLTPQGQFFVIFLPYLDILASNSYRVPPLLCWLAPIHSSWKLSYGPKLEAFFSLSNDVFFFCGKDVCICLLTLLMTLKAESWRYSGV